MAFRCVQVGAGGMGHTWLGILTRRGDVEIAGLVDLRVEAARRLAEEKQVSPAYVGDDLERAIAETKPDFVVDVTVPEAHHDVTVTALAAGLHVLGEKPMAATMEQARAMVAASEKAGRLYMVSQSRRYDERLWAYRRLIESLGGLGILNVDFYLGPHFGGFRDQMASPLLLDMAIHTFDQARCLSGCDPVGVFCEEFNPSWSWYSGDACANALFEMSGGVRFNYRGSWCSEGLGTSWEGSWRAVGRRGTAVWDGHDHIAAETVVRTEGLWSELERHEGVREPMLGGVEGALDDFLNAIRTGKPPMGECHDNIKSLAMVFGAIESSRVGRRVAIGPMLG
ncbi:MAG: Gfo/Idh/MocA family oxidoreductase [Fimbriimonadaceae bacterium]